jgi:endonuclease/exonuclease/phosphatase family metal-dependent hydrolase
MKHLFICTLILLFKVSTHLKAQQLAVGSYNLRYDNLRDSGNLWKDRLLPIANLIRFHEFDVVGTQEGLEHQLQALETTLPEFTYYGIGRDDGKTKGEFSAIFYKKEKFKLLQKGDFWLSTTPEKPGPGWDAHLNRICSWVQLQEKQSGKKMFVFNVHFDHEGQVARIESSKLILRKIREIAGDEPVILTGDFNGDHQSGCYLEMANSGFLKDAYFQVDKPYAPNGSFNGFNSSSIRPGIIDHIFLSRHFQPLKYGVLTDTYQGKFPSDHFPILVKLLLK